MLEKITVKKLQAAYLKGICDRWSLYKSINHLFYFCPNQHKKKIKFDRSGQKKGSDGITKNCFSNMCQLFAFSKLFAMCFFLHWVGDMC